MELVKSPKFNIFVSHRVYCYLIGSQIERIVTEDSTIMIIFFLTGKRLFPPHPCAFGFCVFLKLFSAIHIKNATVLLCPAHAPTVISPIHDAFY